MSTPCVPQLKIDKRILQQLESSQGTASSESDSDPISTARRTDEMRAKVASLTKLRQPSPKYLSFITGDESLRRFPDCLLQQLQVYCRQNGTTELKWAANPGGNHTGWTFRQFRGRRTLFVLPWTDQELDAALYRYGGRSIHHTKMIVVVTQKDQNHGPLFNGGQPAIIVREGKRGEQKNHRGDSTTLWSVWNPDGSLTEGAAQRVIKCETDKDNEDLVSMEAFGNQVSDSDDIDGVASNRYTRRFDDEEEQLNLGPHITPLSSISLKHSSSYSAVSSDPGFEHCESLRQKRARISRDCTGTPDHTYVFEETPSLVPPIELPSLSDPNLLSAVECIKTESTVAKPWPEQINTIHEAVPATNNPSPSQEVLKESSSFAKDSVNPTAPDSCKVVSRVSPLSAATTYKKVTFVFKTSQSTPHLRSRDLTFCNSAQKLFAQARVAGIANKDTLVLQIKINEQDPRIIMCDDAEDYLEVLNEIQSMTSEEDVNVMVMPED